MSSLDLANAPQGFLRLRENSSRLCTCSEERFMHAVAEVKVLQTLTPLKRSNRRSRPNYLPRNAKIPPVQPFPSLTND